MVRTAVFRQVCGLIAASSLLACAPNSSFKLPLQSEASTSYTDKPGWVTSKFAVAAANPLATQVGYRILKAGGSAVDAAIAVQMVLTLVEPQNSGIGGGTFLLHFNGRQVQAFDGRETAPAAATENLLLGQDGKALEFYQAIVGGRTVGTPGTVAVLELAHKAYGKLPWAALFEPAIELATQGFAVSPRLNSLLAADPYLKQDPVALSYFFKTDGSARAVGEILKNPALAAVLKKIAAQGSRALYQGEVAQAMVDKVRQHPTNPGVLSLSDLANYKAVLREPLCFDYRARAQALNVCGFPPPSSGAIAIGQILGLLSHTPAATLPLDKGLPSAQWLHLYTEASRLAFADRAQYVADPDFVQPPAGRWNSLLDSHYLAERAKLIDSAPNAMSMKTATAGVPSSQQALTTPRYAPMPEQPEYGTSHVSIVDADGNALAMTTTIEHGFGSHQMVNVDPALPGGFLLNNELSDFSFAPNDAKGRPIANRVQPGKRPRSSMSPTLIFDKTSGALLMSTGSPGGAVIIHYTAKTIYGVLHWDLSPQAAINLPNFASLNGPTLLEEKRFPASTVNALNARGHQVREINMTSGLQAITRAQVQGVPHWLGGSDPRREGIVMGD